MASLLSADEQRSLQKCLQELHDDPDFAAKQVTSKFLQFSPDEIEAEVLDYICNYLRKREVDDLLSCSLAHSVATSLAEDQERLASYAVKQEDSKQLLDAGLVFNESMNVLKATTEEWIMEMPPFQKSDTRIVVSMDSIKNKRRKMEDRHVHLPHLNAHLGLPASMHPHSFFAVYDGHGGVDAANYAAIHLHLNLQSSSYFERDLQEALKDAVRKTDSSFVAKAKEERLKSGSTAVIVVIQGRKMYVAWLGDSEVVLCKSGQPFQLMVPHKPDREDERKRIDELGGCVVWFGGWRVNACLSVSRAIGDYEQKPYISSEPDVAEFDLEGDEEFLVMACDGLWDVVDEAESVALVTTYLLEGGVQADTARYLVDKAKSRGSMDNITVLVIFFDQDSNKVTVNNVSEANQEPRTTEATDTNDVASSGVDPECDSGTNVKNMTTPSAEI